MCESLESPVSPLLGSLGSPPPPAPERTNVISRHQLPRPAPLGSGASDWSAVGGGPIPARSSVTVERVPLLIGWPALTDACRAVIGRRRQLLRRHWPSEPARPNTARCLQNADQTLEFADAEQAV